MRIWTNLRQKSVGRIIRSKMMKIGFGDILEDEEEVVEKVYRRMLFRMIMRELIWFSAFIYGGGLWSFWFFRGSIWAYIGYAAIAYGLYRMFYTYAHWYLNAIVMTSHNLIFVKWEKFFHRKTVRLDYWNLDEIEVERTGLSSYMYHYGTLHFYKANGGELYSFTQCHAPNRAAREIESYREKLVDNKNFTEESTLKGILSGMVQRHIDEHGDMEVKSEREAQERGKKIDLARQKVEIKEEPRKAKQPWKRKRIADDEIEIEVEKKLDDDGGLSIDL